MVLFLCVIGGLIAGFTLGVAGALAHPYLARRYLEGFSAAGGLPAWPGVICLICASSDFVRGDIFAYPVAHLQDIHTYPAVFRRPSSLTRTARNSLPGSSPRRRRDHRPSGSSRSSGRSWFVR